MTAPDWKNVECFGGEIEGIDEEGYLKLFNPEGEPLVLIDAMALARELAKVTSKNSLE